MTSLRATAGFASFCAIVWFTLEFNNPPIPILITYLLGWATFGGCKEKPGE